jgi:hypothetical protein
MTKRHRSIAAEARWSAAQAGAYLGTTGISVADYLEHYDTAWTALMKNQDKFPLQ